jgi:hypothetical protein
MGETNVLSFLFKTKPAQPDLDADLELAKLALQDRLDVMLAKDVRRKLRFNTLAEIRQ